jgi:DnaJ-class molecular chaperone
MPLNLVHCQFCRALLNPDLKSDSVEIPEFVPLREIASMIDIDIRGFYLDCPHCQRELRINRKYVGQTVQCKFCAGGFSLDINRPITKATAFYTTCPYCEDELRAAMKYAGAKVSCKRCSGKIHILSEADTTA